MTQTPPTPTPAHEHDIEVDPAVLVNEDTDDYASSGYDTSTASLTSSINEYIYENGRRYHSYFGPDKNLQPTDETEQDRLDLHHEIFLLLLDRELHKAPLESPHRILDIGTGTGIWAIDMADKYPMAEVIGTNLSPIQPRWVPPNCKFEVDDAEEEFTFRTDYFDFIHARNIAQAITDWPKLMAQAYRCIKPGGYIELAELGCIVHSDDGTMAPDNGAKRFMDLLGEAMVKLGRPPDVTGEFLRENLQNAGFVDIEVHNLKQPFGPWAREKRLKKIGAFAMMSGETGFHSYGMAVFTRVLGMTSDEANEACNAAIAAMRNKNTHMYNYFYVVYGRKPTDS